MTEKYIPSDEALHEADDIINSLKAHTDVDYTPGRNEIARMFDDFIWNGHWDITTDFAEAGVEGLRDLRLIQEDHYDQHMDHEEDRPSWESMLFMEGAYVWFADVTS